MKEKVINRIESEVREFINKLTSKNNEIKKIHNKIILLTAQINNSTKLAQSLIDERDNKLKLLVTAVEKQIENWKNAWIKPTDREYNAFMDRAKKTEADIISNYKVALAPYNSMVDEYGELMDLADSKSKDRDKYKKKMEKRFGIKLEDFI